MHGVAFQECMPSCASFENQPSRTSRTAICIQLMLKPSLRLHNSCHVIMLPSLVYSKQVLCHSLEHLTCGHAMRSNV